jgi:hypothetical protein
MDGAIYQLAQDFQTFLVGVVGFAGVILTIIQSGRQARKTQKAHQKHERGAIRAAIRCELEELQKTVVDQIGNISSKEGRYDLYIPKRVPIEIYKATISRIGLLTTEEIQAIHYAYLCAEELSLNLGILSFNAAKRISGSPDTPDGYIWIDQTESKHTLETLDSFNKLLTKALEQIDKNQE